MRRFDAVGIEGSEEGGGKLYRSIMVIRGETRPEAQVAAVKSDVIRQSRWSVFQL